MLSSTPKQVEICEVRDLKEGDVAEIKYRSAIHVVFIFRVDDTSCLKMVSLSCKESCWDNVSNNGLPVLRIFKEGDTLTVS